MSGSRELKNQTRDLLVELGTSRTEVARTLRSLGVRAVPNDPQDCAVAVYLRAVMGADRRIRSFAVQSGDVKVLVDEPKWFRLPNVVRVLLPAPVRDFIAAFDGRVYPDLVLRDRASSSMPESPVS
jgi:hypothetical protein